MTIFWTILIGLFIGLVARALMPGKDAAGFMITAILGIAGAFLGSLLARILGIYAPGEVATLIMSILGALVLLGVYRFAVTAASPQRM